MNLISWIVCGLVVVAVAGCEPVALRPRPDIDRPGAGRKDIPRQEIVGTVEQVDKTKKEIQLRTTEAQLVVIKYDGATVVYSRERQVGIDSLQPRDLILVQAVKTGAGDRYADIIRMNDRP